GPANCVPMNLAVVLGGFFLKSGNITDPKVGRVLVKSTHDAPRNRKVKRLGIESTLQDFDVFIRLFDRFEILFSREELMKLLGMLTAQVANSLPFDQLPAKIGNIFAIVPPLHDVVAWSLAASAHHRYRNNRLLLPDSDTASLGLD